MKTLFFPVFLLVVATATAQYPIGHRTIDFTDPARTRTITCEIYYPGISAGDDVNCATGLFPLIIFGHGYMMGFDAYLNFTENLIPKGYVIVFPTTETSMSPNHEAFGLDLKFLNDEIKVQSVSNSSFFLYNHFNGKTAIAGHSMGGGASFLAAAGNNNLTALINFAAAETDPSAITAAASVSVPSVVFIGENDGVAPPDEHQTPMYIALQSCKYKINILGGGHCYFANSNTLCSTAEIFTTPQPTITREEQHEIQFNMLFPFLEWQLNGNSAMKMVFEDSIQNSSRIQAAFNCPQTMLEQNENFFTISPNPASEYLNIYSTSPIPTNITLFDATGRACISVIKCDKELNLNMEDVPNGLYFLHLSHQGTTTVSKVVVQHN